MTKSFFFIAFLVSTKFLALASSKSVRYETLLLTDLLTNYSTTSRPVEDSKQAVQVQMDFKLSKIVKLDIKEQQLVVNARILFQWNDPALVWNTADYNGTGYVNMPMTSIWTPDILLYNTASESSESHSDVYKAHVRIDNTGQVVWMSPVTLKASCDINVKWFPFDSQSCSLLFGSISLTNNKLLLKFYKQPGSVSAVKGKFHYTSGIWNLETLTTKTQEQSYDCCKEPFSLINYTIVLRRLPTYWVLYLVLPCLFLAIISLCTFYIPPETGERIGYGITVVLAMSVYLLVISDKLPEKSDTKPLIGIMYIVLFIIMILILISVVFTTHIAFKVTKPPRRLRHLFCKRCYESKKKRQGVDIVSSLRKPATAETDMGSEMDFVSKRDEDTGDFPRETLRRRITLKQQLSFLTGDLDESEIKYQEEWRSIAERLDKIFFWVFSAITILCPFIIVGIFAA